MRIKQIGLCGVIGPDAKDNRDFIYQKDKTNEEIKAGLNNIVEEFSLKQYSCPVMNQMQTNSCTGHASAVAMNILLSRTLSKNKDYKLNPFWIYYWARKQSGFEKVDSGAYIRDTMKALKENGVWRCDMTTPFSELPTDYDIKNTFKIKEYLRIDNSIDKVQYALFNEKLPIIGSIKVFQGDIDNYYGLIKGDKLTGFAGYHAVPIIGWKYIKNVLYFIIQNSWGRANGDGGFYYLNSKYIEDGMLTPDLWTFTYEYF